MSVVPTATASLDDLQAIATEQRRELMSAQALDSDLDFAFSLQLQEAITASLIIDQPSSSAAAAVPQPPLPNDDGDGEDVSGFTELLSDEVLRLEQELKDLAISETEFRKFQDDLHRRIHDRQVALEISKMPEEEWEDWGDDYERPFGEGTSKGVSGELFRVYFKGLVEKQMPEGISLGGIGVAICDSNDELLFELRKPLVGNGMMTSRSVAEAQALIEALNAAIELGLERVIGQWSAKQRKVTSLINQVTRLREKFVYCQPYLVPRNDIKFAFKLAREAIVSQAKKAAESSGSKNPTETCTICTEDTNITRIFSVDDCKHRYCFSCMKQHVEVKLLHGLFPTCPHEGCKTELKLDSCCKFLTPRLIEIMRHRIKEASIPVTEKVYCPYPKCSALMSKREVLEYSRKAIVGAEISKARKCVKCDGRFCVDCKVPWHNNMTCLVHKTLYPQPEEMWL
ncbi:probable E3 ubiquitin-protein ligase rbra [Phtheirospermum japonicum]|uniref:RBR-type E3 ubiquitin transferase n=1 Tax=Phtheirospermum japonicum TaxID=374723 RepID=A0A830CF62_9LAMI|nr:probable E3 ubiquitin-protein ligase rbra [Phtheirospermum japonicum]